jgi:hypothetical protein
MNTWEYKSFTVYPSKKGWYYYFEGGDSSNNYPQLYHLLNSEGREGWELVQMIQSSECKGCFEVVFKRIR